MCARRRPRVREGDCLHNDYCILCRTLHTKLRYSQRQLGVFCTEGFRYRQPENPV